MYDELQGNNELAAKEKCKRFYDRFGSHALRGPFEFGGTFICNSSVTYQSESEAEEARRSVAEKMETEFGVSGWGASVQTNSSNSSA